MTGNSVSFAHSAIAQTKFVLVGSPGALFHRIIDLVRSLQESEPISVDDLTRQEVLKGSANGVALSNSTTANANAANERVLGLLRRWFWNRKRGKGFLVSGFPANRAQALVFEEWLENKDEELSACLVVQQSEKDALDEARGCHKCPIDGRRFYFETTDGFHSKVCDSCGSELVAIPVEARAEVRSWFASKSDSAESLLNHFRERGLLQLLSSDEFSPTGGANLLKRFGSMFACS